MPDSRRRPASIPSSPPRRCRSYATCSSPASRRALLARLPRHRPRRPRPTSRRSASATPPFFGPEAEFFVFDDVKFRLRPATTSPSRSTPVELPTKRHARLRGAATWATAYPTKGAATSPSRRSIRRRTHCARRCSAAMAEMVCVKSRSTTTEGSPRPSGRARAMEVRSTLVRMADLMQVYKYTCIHQTSSFVRQVGDPSCPMPGYGRKRQTGSGMPRPTSRSEGRQAASSNRRQVRRPCPRSSCTDIGGHHQARQKALNAFTNPSTKLLQASRPGLRGAGGCWPYSARNPLGLLPHPVGRTSPKAQARRGPLPDPTAVNPYLAFAAIPRRC